jgi:TolB protein
MNNLSAYASRGALAALALLSVAGLTQVSLLAKEPNTSVQLSGWLVASNANGPHPHTDLNIYLIRPDGTGKRFLTNDSKMNAHPAWSFDGTKIVYSVVTPEGAAIWMMDADGGNKKQLMFPPSNGVVPSFSPDGRRIVYFAPGPQGHAEIFLMNADGTNQRRLTTTTGAVPMPNGARMIASAAPSFSPDGTKIVYSSTQNGHIEIWLMNADGSAQRPLTVPDDRAAPDANAPSWSPDGTRIAFWSGTAASQGNIWVMNADGGNRRQLTLDPANHNSDNPAWSPDGKYIIYESDRAPPPPAKTWIIDADGRNPRILLPDAYGMGRRPWKADN